ncbi:hypothetical protein [Hymenobacter rubripertinctus]|uniref:Uncharacterized protein n=1 Tax=Hymenobacter rubripertinctus TaxID=2029981 RepID=A0A418R0P8_9BACT|nr:hypothetical protein [Hymenobacter rubripertinctus]RIY10997.1 hypothetical protein D0T11_08275 [Hymenobacter rubripertinctus]
MKNVLFLVFFCLSVTLSMAQSGTVGVLGRYEQDNFVGPASVKVGEQNVVITRDPALSKVVWIANLLRGGRVKALLHQKTGSTTFYSIPAQKVGGYQIQAGCAMYDQQEGTVMISLNNKMNCFGMNQSDYDAGVSVSKNGRVSAGGVVVDGRGGVKAPGVQVGQQGVKVDSKVVMAGVQYIGTKEGRPRKDDDD